MVVFEDFLVNAPFPILRSSRLLITRSQPGEFQSKRLGSAQAIEAITQDVPIPCPAYLDGRSYTHKPGALNGSFQFARIKAQRLLVAAQPNTAECDFDNTGFRGVLRYSPFLQPGPGEPDDSRSALQGGFA